MSTPVGLLVVCRGIPPFLGHTGLAVVDTFELGRVSLSNADGELPTVQLHKARQLIYPIADSQTLFAFDLVAGLTIDVTELAAGP